MIDSTNITDSELKQTALALANNAENILAAAQEDAGLEKILKFDKGRYLIGEELVPLGSEFLAHCEAWVKQWIKYFDHRVVVQKLYRVDLGERPPEREELDDLDPSRWPPGLDDRPADPWQFYYLLPLEKLENGEIVIFRTKSFGGRRAIGDLCRVYGKRASKGRGDLPIIKLATTEMPTKKYGKVPRPEFVIVRWDEAANDIVNAAPATLKIEAASATRKEAPATLKDELNDTIPF